MNLNVFYFTKDKQQNTSLMWYGENVSDLGWKVFHGLFEKYLLIHLCFCFRNMVLAERCVLLSAEILKSQSKYSEAAALLIRLTSEVKHLVAFPTLALPPFVYLPKCF